MFFPLDVSTGNSNIELNEMHDYKDTNDVKNSKSCPVIYKVSKQNDGTTVHELLTEDLSKGLRLNKPSNDSDEQQQETPLHHKPLKEKPEKLNIILDENGKSTLYDITAAAASSSGALTKTDNLKKDIKQLSLDLTSNVNNNINNKYDLSLQQPSLCDSNKKVLNSLAAHIDDNIPTTSSAASLLLSSSSSNSTSINASSLISPSLSNVSSSSSMSSTSSPPTSPSCNED